MTIVHGVLTVHFEQNKLGNSLTIIDKIDPRRFLHEDLLTKFILKETVTEENLPLYSVLPLMVNLTLWK